MPTTLDRDIDARKLMEALMLGACERGASDLHLLADERPACRIHGKLHCLDETALGRTLLEQLLISICPPALLDRFQLERDLDFSFELPYGDQRLRFRANYFYNQGNMGACFRLIPSAIPNLSWASFPDELAQRLTRFRNGLVLVTGVAGSGKTTTLAMLIDLLATRGGYRIITIEEPVEYHFPKRAGSVVSQREVGMDVASFGDGLKYGLRQDPDVILVGEIRDRETAQMALSAAETGHLVFSTMHTRDAKGAISRLADLFPQSAQADVRSQLSMSLRAVISQHLLPGVQADAKRQLALEILFNTTPVSSAIRSGRIETVDNCILTGRADGMNTLDESLRQLLQAGQITPETARSFATDPKRLGLPVN